MPDGKLRKNLK